MFRYGVNAVFLLFFVLLFSSVAYSQEGKKQYSSASTIIEIEGAACLGQDRTRTQTQRLALKEAKRNASESVLTHVKSETNIEDGMLADDIIKSYSLATVRVLEELDKGWAKTNSGSYVDDCYKIKIKAEVVPLEGEPGSSEEKKVAKKAIDNPLAPLTVELWTSQETYSIGDNMKFFFRGNKPFYGHAVYIDADGNHIQITDKGKSKYFKGGSIYEIPGDADNFVLRITPPIGKEKLVLYTSTQPMGKYEGEQAGDFFVVSGDYRNLDESTRGLAKMKATPNEKFTGKAEFAEARVEVKVVE